MAKPSQEVDTSQCQIRLGWLDFDLLGRIQGKRKSLSLDDCVVRAFAFGCVRLIDTKKKFINFQLPFCFATFTGFIFVNHTGSHFRDFPIDFGEQRMNVAIDGEFREYVNNRLDIPGSHLLVPVVQNESYQ